MLDTPDEMPGFKPRTPWLPADLTGVAIRTDRHLGATERGAAVRRPGRHPSFSPPPAMQTDAAGTTAVADFVDHDLFEAAIVAHGSRASPRPLQEVGRPRPLLERSTRRADRSGSVTPPAQFPGVPASSVSVSVSVPVPVPSSGFKCQRQLGRS